MTVKNVILVLMDVIYETIYFMSRLYFFLLQIKIIPYL